MKTRIWVHQRMECLWFLDPEDNPRLIRSSFSIDGHEILLTRIFIGGRPVSLASWAKIRSQSVAFAAAPMKIDGMAMNIQAKPAQTDWIRALLALLAERTRWKYACHGRPPKINIMKLSTHRGASKNILNDRLEITSYKIKGRSMSDPFLPDMDFRMQMIGSGLPLNKVTFDHTNVSQPFSRNWFYDQSCPWSMSSRDWHPSYWT